jgi:peptidoglycan/LPS O-acetylase OafA/YrhL
MGVLRLLLALAVVLQAHSTPLFGVSMIGGAWAVQGFYVISGFYMALVLNEKYGAGAAGYREFIGQRLLRLLPGYWICLAAAILVGVMGWGTSLPVVPVSAIHFWRQHADRLPGYQLAYVVVSQALLLGVDWLLFLGVSPDGALHFIRDIRFTGTPGHEFIFVGPVWSLGVELAFYLVAPFIVRRRAWVIALVVMASVAVRVVVWRGLRQPGDPPNQYLSTDPWVYRFFPSELGTFLMGSLAYRFYAWTRSRRLDIRRAGWAAWAVILAAIFVLPHRPLGAPGVCLTLLMPVCLPFVFALTKSWRVDRWVGELSYPVYIAHFVVGAVVARVVNAHVVGDVKGWVLLSWTLPFALLIRLGIEEPIDRWRQRWYEGRRRVPVLASPTPM